MTLFTEYDIGAIKPRGRGRPPKDTCSLCHQPKHAREQFANEWKAAIENLTYTYIDKAQLLTILEALKDEPEPKPMNRCNQCGEERNCTPDCPTRFLRVFKPKPPEPKAKCYCACHANKLNKPYGHDTKCCAAMNGYLEPPEPKGWEEEFDKRFVQDNDPKDHGILYLFRVNKDGSRSIALPEDIKSFIKDVSARFEKTGYWEGIAVMKEEMERVEEKAYSRGREDSMVERAEFSAGEAVRKIEASARALERERIIKLIKEE